MSDTSTPPASRHFSPTPVETMVKTRRFAAEPVETVVRIGKKQDILVHNTEEVVPMEKKADIPTKRRFVPEPVETSFKSSKQTASNPLPTPEPTPVSIDSNFPSLELPKPRRKFEPQLIESSRRSKRAGDLGPATLHTDKTDLTPGVPNIYTRQKRQTYPLGTLTPLRNTSDHSTLSVASTQIPPLPPRRQGSMRPHLNTRRSTRQNSFQPELDIIPSDDNSDKDGSGESTPSLSGSFGSSDGSHMKLQMARTRESCDDRFSGYLLELAAKAAEKQLREQALAAFPNETFHEIVEHFYDREVDGSSEEGSVEGIGFLVDEPPVPLEIRRKSTEIGWAQKEMQAHQEKLSRLREEETNKKIAAEATTPTFNDPFWTNGMTSKFAQRNSPHDKQKEAELQRMRSAASPPMLGSDLQFRMCPSPKATKFESDQKPQIQIKRSENGGGLWGGYCVTEEAGEYLTPSSRGPVLIHTPHVEREDPFSSASPQDIPCGARSPRSNHNDGGVRMLSGLDDRLQAEAAKAKAEEALLAEFDDSFVTQVYNYLSLGYPTLARQYDDELARISRIPDTELQVDDRKKKAKGYLGIGDDTPSNENGQPACPRWKALRVYILEWARQHPNMSNGSDAPNAWGVRARRGSWAI